MNFLILNIRNRANQLFVPTFSTIRRNSFLAIENARTNVVSNHLREVLTKRSDCIFFDIKTHPTTHCWEKEINDLVLVTSAGNTSKSITNSERIEKLLKINDFCLKNYTKWNNSKQLYVLDIWHTIRQARYYNSTNQIKDNLIDQIPAMTEIGQILQTLYYTSWLRKSLNGKQQKTIQQKLVDIRNSLTIDEQSIFCVALIKCQGKLENAEMVDGLITSIMDVDLQSCNSVTINSLSKAIRWYSTPDNIFRTKELQEKLIPYAKQVEIKGLIHIGLLGYNLQHFNYYLVEIIIRRILENLDKIRIKDVERAFLILSALTVSKFTVRDAILRDFYVQVQEYLLNSFETKHPDTMIRCIAYMTICGITNLKLIEWSLGDGLAACKILKKPINHFTQEILIIDTFSKINLEKYNGPSLNDAVCTEYRNTIFADFDGHNKTIADCILKLFNEHNLHILPHRILPYSALLDLIFVYDEKTNETKPFSQRLLRNIIKSSDLHENDPNLKAIAFVTSSWQQQLHSKNVEHGHFQHKLNQLKLLGFKTITIPQKNWNNFKTVEAKKRYLIRELNRHHVYLFKK